MSWAQFKKRYDELTAYLGKDSEGIKRLKLLKDEVNELRTSLATAKEETQLAQTIKDAARERADVAETAMEELRIHSKSQDLKIQSMAQRVETLSKTISDLSREEEPEEEDLSPDKEAAAIRAVVRTLRRKLRYCPGTVGVFSMAEGEAPIFTREDIVKGWSHDNIWTLGASVAVLISLLGRVALHGDMRLIEITPPGGTSNLSRHAYEWLSHNNVNSIPPVGSVRTAMAMEKEKLRNAKGAIFD